MNQLQVPQTLDELEKKVYKVIELNKGKWLDLTDLNLLSNLPFSYLLQILPLLCSQGLVESKLEEHKSFYKWLNQSNQPKTTYQREPIVARINRKKIGSIKYSSTTRTKTIQQKIQHYFTRNPQKQLVASDVNRILFDNKIPRQTLQRILVGMPLFLNSKKVGNAHKFYLRKEE